tara:strand:+ start:746 stop:1279 length:534 start_codon:yes stop_codon:yes gene_type:complete
VSELYEPSEGEAKDYEERLENVFDMQDLVTYFPAPIKTMFGGNVIFSNDNKLEQKRFKFKANNPVVVMAMFWESLWQQFLMDTHHALVNTLQTLVKDIKDDEHNTVPTELIESLLKKLATRKASDELLELFYKMMPDAVAIGNPDVIGRSQAKMIDDKDIKGYVDDMLKEIFNAEEE